MIMISVMSLGCVWLPLAIAQTVASRPDGPVACDAFQRVGNGSWAVLRPATIYPEGVALGLRERLLRPTSWRTASKSPQCSTATAETA